MSAGQRMKLVGRSIILMYRELCISWQCRRVCDTFRYWDICDKLCQVHFNVNVYFLCCLKVINGKKETFIYVLYEAR